MEVILLESVTNLGELGDAVTVKAGYARNYLLPTKKAVLATPEAIEEVNKRREELLKEEKHRLDVAKARAEKAVKELTFARNVIDSDGRLFGSISVTDIVEGAAEVGMELARSEVDMPDGVIKSTGEHRVVIHTHPEVSFDINVIVTASGEDIVEQLIPQEEEVVESGNDEIADASNSEEESEEEIAEPEAKEG